MVKKRNIIPINSLAGEFHPGIAIEKISIRNIKDVFEEARQSHREDRHAFFLVEKGTVAIEIDFKKFEIKPCSIIYMHPDQVHRITAFKNMVVNSWSIDNENLNPEYLKLLESLKPVEPLLLKKEAFAVISRAADICLELYKTRNGRLYQSIIKDSCNTLVALVLSQFLKQSKPLEKQSRFEIVTTAFRHLLERDYIRVKRPAGFAGNLNISVAYLNECVKKATGNSVSYYIQERVILEAKRLLYHSDKTVKEISAALGYDDYPYFSRLFSKVTGLTPLSFRNKNLG